MSQAKQERFEEAVLGILFRNPEAITKHDIDERHFVKWNAVVVAIKQVAAKGEELDILSVAQHMGRNDLLLTLNDIMQNSTGALANLQKYLDGLRDIWRSEQLRNSLTASIAELGNGGEVDAIINQLMQSTLKAAASETRKHTFTMKEAMSVFYDQLEQTFDARDSGGIGIKTGIADLDKALGGLHPSDMIIVGARPGMGKTAWAVSVMVNMAKTGKRVGFVSSEMSASQVMLRITSLDSSVAGHKLRDANLDDNDWMLLTASTNRLANLDVRVYDKPAVTVADVMLQSKAWMIDGGLDVLVVDYLTRIKPVKSTGNQTLDVGDVATSMKNIARTLNIPVVVLAQLNRDAANKRPVMANLRDSGIIEQEADQILMLYRDEEDETSPAEIIIEKNRHGESMTRVMCHFDKETMRWADIARGYDD